MALASASFFTETVENQLDDLLMRICVELQLDESRYQLTEASYRSVGKWLESEHFISVLKPAIYPQGSMRLGTTVKPLSGDEYDLDFVCELSCTTDYFTDPAKALDLIEYALRSNANYDPMVERLKRCIRLNFSRKFHMDILPACRDQKNAGTCILVPDDKLKCWTASNPKGYASWFDDRARQSLVRGTFDKAEPIPGQERVQRKSPLKLCVQLLKRERDLRYRNRPEAAPISIVLTTLAAHFYRGEQSIALAMRDILSGICGQILSNRPRLVVLNPKNSDEDLSECWDSKPGTYGEFVSGIGEFNAQWTALLQTRGIHNVARLLERFFGEELARGAVAKQTQDIETLRGRNELGMKKASGIMTGLASSSVVAIKPHTFYGTEK
jgi:SMODS domain-containing protein